MSRPSDAFHSELDYLWRAVADAQDFSARAEAQRAEARTGMVRTAARLQRLEKELALSRERERELKNETAELRAAMTRDAATLAAAARITRENRDGAVLKALLRKKDSETTLLDAELGALREETAGLKELLKGRDDALALFREKLSALMSLPELARTLKEDAELSGKRISVYERLLEKAAKSGRSAAAAAEELAKAAEQDAAARASLAAAERELSDLRSALQLKTRELESLRSALTEAVSREKLTAGEKASLEGRASALVAALAERTAALETSLSDCALLKKKLAEAGIEADRLRQTSEEQALKTREQRSNFTGAVTQVFELQKKAAQLRTELAQLQEDNGRLSAALRERDADIEKVNGLLREAKNGLGQEKEISKRAALKIRTLETEIDALKARVSASGEYASRLLKAVEERDLLAGALKADLKKIPALEMENEDLRRRNIKFSGLLRREQSDFNSGIVDALEKAVKDLKGFNLRIPAAERKALEPAMKSLLASVNLMKGWQEYMDPETPDMEDTDLAAFVTGEAGKWERAFKQRKFSLSTAVVAPRLRARLAPERIRMLFYHLIKNAYERLPPGGGLRIALKGSEDGRQAILSFEDTGPGFTQEVLGKLFAPFNTTGKGRIGIGLAVAQRIAEKHGGAIAVSNRKERGALVEVRLPLGNTAP